MRRAARGGFTLVEILVAIAIVAALMGMLLPAITSSRRGASVHAAKATIERIRLACAAYQADFGDYPPTLVGSTGTNGNGANEGNEALMRCLATKLENGPYLAYDDKDLGDTDQDKLHELLDPWGSPYVYFHNRDYRGGGKVERYLLAQGGRTSVRPPKSDKTGTFPSETTFILWSAGPDGVNENGQGDDVCSWK